MGSNETQDIAMQKPAMSHGIVSSNQGTTNIMGTPNQNIRPAFNMPTPTPSQQRIHGDVALTPTNSSVYTPMSTNPHSAMTALTPITSGSRPTENSIKLQ